MMQRDVVMRVGIQAAGLALASLAVLAVSVSRAAGDTGAGADDPALTAFTAVCEHGIAQCSCEECRYEIGLVKVAADLLEGSDAGPGLIDVVEAGHKPIELVLDVTGEIQLNAVTEVHVSPRIPGVVREVMVDIGTAVEQGDVLFTIESTELGRAIGEYRKNLAMADISRRNYLREKALFEQSIGSEVDMLDAQMKLEQYQADLEAAEHELHVMGLSESDVEALRTGNHAAQTGRLPYRAPRAGRVIQKHITVGELAEPGEDVMLLADLSTVWAWLDIYEQDLGALQQSARRGDLPVAVYTGAYPDREFTGRLDLVGATMDEQTRTVKSRAILDNPGELLRPGMFCRARIGLRESDTALQIPRDALLSDEGQTFVFKRLREDYYIRQPVKAGREFAGTVEVCAGLTAGDWVVSRGAFLLKSDILREKMGAGCAD